MRRQPLKLPLLKAKRVQRDFQYLEKSSLKYAGNEYKWIRLLVVPSNYMDINMGTFIERCCDLFFKNGKTVFEVEDATKYTIVAILRNDENRTVVDFTDIVSDNNLDFNLSAY